MKIGLLSDAHGNPDGLALSLAVLREKGAERLFFLGDAVGYLPRWLPVLAMLREQGVTCIRGNHDDHVLKACLREDVQDAYQHLPSYLESIQSYTEWMATWPESITLELDGMRLMLVHASPQDTLNGYVYPWTDVTGISWPAVDVIAMGHTHRPMVRTHEGLLLLNPGSCGLPRDIGHLASCATVDTLTREAVVYRVPFDVASILGDLRFIHPDVRECLSRSGDPYEGQLVDRPIINIHH
jgi:putative phosphoesterase